MLIDGRAGSRELAELAAESLYQVESITITSTVSLSTSTMFLLTPCQIVCDPLGRGVDSHRSQKRTIEDFGAMLGSGCSSCSVLVLVLELVLVLVLERR